MEDKNQWSEQWNAIYCEMKAALSNLNALKLIFHLSFPLQQCNPEDLKISAREAFMALFLFLLFAETA